MADRTIMALDRPAKPAKGSKKVAANKEERERVFDVFRRWGYYEATLDPLGVALLPVPDKVGIKPRGPTYSTFQKGKLQRGEAPRHAAHE